jgi:Glycosyl transferase family group 2
MMTQSTLLLVLQWVLLAFFLIPSIEVAMMVLGAVWAHFLYAQAPGKFQYLIIQVTTVGREPDLVQRTVDKIRSYNLPMPHEIWIAVEPGMYVDYADVDQVIVVPASFRCRAIDKARALEYTRRLRSQWLAAAGRDPAGVKLLLVDDDTLPSRKYVLKAFNGNYDVCQGPTVPNRWYGTGGIRHFILSHLDNIRTRNCLIYCSCTQGVTQKPLFVHGEGLCMTCRAESIVTWDKPIVASDDLVFGTTAAHLGLSWGYFQGAAIQLVSPWSFRENLKQRRRWTWGNLDAIGSRQIMPRAAAIFKGFKYGLGFASIICSTTGAVLLRLGYAKVPPQAHDVFWCSLILWFASYGLTGWINSGGEPNRERLGPRTLYRSDYRFRLTWGWACTRNMLRLTRVSYWSNRVLQTACAVILTPLTALTPVFIITLSVLRGRPKRFEMITKSNAVMNRAATRPGPAA